MGQQNIKPVYLDNVTKDSIGRLVKDCKKSLPNREFRNDLDSSYIESLTSALARLERRLYSSNVEVAELYGSWVALNTFERLGSEEGAIRLPLDAKKPLSDLTTSLSNLLMSLPEAIQIDLMSYHEPNSADAGAIRDFMESLDIEDIQSSSGFDRDLLETIVKKFSATNRSKTIVAAAAIGFGAAVISSYVLSLASSGAGTFSTSILTALPKAGWLLLAMLPALLVLLKNYTDLHSDTLNASSNASNVATQNLERSRLARDELKHILDSKPNR